MYETLSIFCKSFSRKYRIKILPSILLGLLGTSSVLGPFSEYITKYSTIFYTVEDIAFMLTALFLFIKILQRDALTCLFSAILLIFSSSLSRSDAGVEALRAMGFQVRLTFDSSLAHHCHSTAFLGKSGTQELAFCESFSPLGQDFAYNFFFDTSGEISLPPNLREAEWTNTMNTFPGGKFYSFQRLNVKRLRGNFYNVITDFVDGDKSYLGVKPD